MGSKTLGVSIVASHGKRMICILRSFLLDYDKLKLEPVGTCINDFYQTIQSGTPDRKFLKKDKNLPGTKITYEKSKCNVYDFDKTFPNFSTGIQGIDSESSNMKCFPQFINGSALNITIERTGNDVYVSVDLLPPDDVLQEDEDLHEKLVFRNNESESEK